jgi:FkbM family methyltransferase
MTVKVSDQNFLNKIGKAVAKPLSRLFANARTEQLSLLADAYLCILLGKGAGSGWALDVEVKAAAGAIHHPSPVIFDVGANTGEWSLLMQQSCPQGSRFFLFEPQPACQKILEGIRIPNSMLIPHAVSSEAGQTLKLFVGKEASGLAALDQRRDSYFDGIAFSSIDVTTVTIDNVVQENGLDRIDLLKMDVEGHELSVLKGATRNLEQGRIKALTFEFGSGNINSRTFFHDFWDFLTPFGFEIYRILPSGRLMLIKEYYEDCEYFRGVTNYIAKLQ